MIVFSIFILLTAAALPSINIAPIQITRCATLTFLSAATLAADSITVSIIGSGISLYNSVIQVTPLTQSIDTFLYIIAGIITGFTWNQYSSHSISSWNRIVPVSEYSIILIFTTIGASILISSTNLVTLYLGLELQSFAVYILCCLNKNSETSSAAALKYFFIGGLSSAIILIGGAIIYWQTGTLNLWNQYYLMNNISENLDNIKWGIILGIEGITLGILIKTASAPFHFWAPDVYDGVPTIVTTWLTLIPKISLLTFLLHIITIGKYIPFNSQILITCSLFSLIIGTVVGLAQSRIKRLLAYSTISHVGYIILALSIITEWGIDSFIFYLIQYTITTLNAFLILLAFGSNQSDEFSEESDIKFSEDLKGQFFINPIIGITFSICLFSIAGVPPFIGFFGKQIVLSAAIQTGYIFIAFVGILTSIVSATYYLNIVRQIHFEKSSKIIKSGKSQSLTFVHSYTISILTSVITFFILAPYFILDSTNLLALSFYSS